MLEYRGQAFRCGLLEPFYSEGTTQSQDHLHKACQPHWRQSFCKPCKARYTLAIATQATMPLVNEPC
jgi:hypothetical protein